MLDSLLLETQPERRSTLRRRLIAQQDILRDRLALLYGNNSDFEIWLEKLLLQTLSAASMRSQELWQLDLAREQQPGWQHNAALAYCAYVDKFGGTLRGVTERISHLQELGVTYLHLLPFLKAGTPPNDGGFAVASYSEIEPALGTEDDLRALTAQLRQAGISLCSDFVLNHVSNEHTWAQQALAGHKEYQAYFHWRQNSEEVAQWEPYLSQVFPGTAPGNFTFVPQVNASAWTTFYPYQWDLNYSNPAVFADMAQALLNLANQGVESFRLDSTAFLWKRLGTACQNQPEVHHILQALRALVDIAAPGVLLKAEAIMPTRELPPYFGLGGTPGPECHVAYHSSLMTAGWLALAEQDAQVLREVLAQTPPLPAGCSWMTYVRCHDDIGWNVLQPELIALGTEPAPRLLQASRFFAGDLPGGYARGETFQANDASSVHGTNGMTSALAGLASAQTAQARQLATDRLLLLHGLSQFVGGLPLIYMGDEFALGNTPASEMAAREGTDGRELQRPQFDEAAFALRRDPDTTQSKVFQTLCHMSHARRQHSGLRADLALQVVDLDCSAVLGLRRGEGFLGLFNFSEKTFQLDLAKLRHGGSAIRWADVLNADLLLADTLTLPGHGIRWINLCD